MGKAFRTLLCVLAAVAGGAHAADVQVVLQSCTDNKGHSVASRSDDAAKKVVETRIEDGKPVLVYNTKVLPHLLPETRTFFYAHECVRNNLGLAPAGELNMEQAKRADCAAVAALKRSKLVSGANELAAIEMDAELAAEGWAHFPGPARKLALGNCANTTAGTLALPTAASSEKWNRCVHGCGERLRACGTGPTCQQTYSRCSASCENP